MATAGERFAAHVKRTRVQDLPAHAVAAAKVFILDTLGVGISGSTAAGAEPLLQSARSWGAAPEAQVWGRGDRLPAPAAEIGRAHV